MTSKWINIAAVCGIAVTFITGCTNTRKQQPKPSGAPAILRNRDIVPSPYTSPDAVRGITPARPSATAPVLPGNLAVNTASQQPPIPTYIPPQQDIAADQQAIATAPSITPLFPTLENADSTTVAPPPPPKGASKNQQVSMATRGTPQKPVKPTVFESPVTTSPSPKPVPAASGRTVTVKSGDTLSGIAYKYGVKTDTLASVNGINKNAVLKIGTVLALPAGALESPRALPAKTHPAPQGANVKKASTGTGTAPAQAPKEGTHVVKANESLWKIAKNYKIKFEDIQKWNPNYADKPLQPGQVIYIKDPGTVSSKPAATEKKAPEQPKKPEAQNNGASASPAVQPAAVAKEPAPIGGLPQTQEKDAGSEDKGVIHYTIRDKDTLEVLAQIYGTTVDAIKKQNPGIDSNEDLKPGNKIDIPYTLLKP